MHWNSSQRSFGPIRYYDFAADRNENFNEF